MKLPNGYGTVYKLSGKRRNPWIARKTTGWEIDPKTGKAKQRYVTIGYYPTRKDALNALAEFKRGSNGVVEVKFTDRMGIITALMERCQEDPTEALLRQLGGMTDE